jgi:transposase-like protein
MKRRRWDSKTKTKIVLEGLSGKPVSEICNEYGIHQNQYYIWRDKFLSEGCLPFLAGSRYFRLTLVSILRYWQN